MAPSERQLRVGCLRGSGVPLGDPRDGLGGFEIEQGGLCDGPSKCWGRLIPPMQRHFLAFAFGDKCRIPASARGEISQDQMSGLETPVSWKPRCCLCDVFWRHIVGRIEQGEGGPMAHYLGVGKISRSKCEVVPVDGFDEALPISQNRIVMRCEQ